MQSRMFSLRNDICELKKSLEQYPQCRLIIIDPISAYLGGIDSHKNADVRSLLAPLAEIAAQYRVAVISRVLWQKGSGD